MYIDAPMSSQNRVDTDELILRAIRSLEKEIEAVREKPSSDILYQGERQSSLSGTPGQIDIKFETHQPAIRFAEQIRATNGEKEWTVTPVSFEKNVIVLRFPEDPGPLAELQVEWENDFVLQRTLEQLEKLRSADSHTKERIDRLFRTDGELADPVAVVDDGMRNEAQRRAMEQSARCPSLFIWGPPGTGKTATLGYIIANYLKRGKSVLFASNTNRAVDVGLISTLRALERVAPELDRRSLCRFGDPALEEQELEEVLFERQLENLVREREAQGAAWADLLAREEELRKAVEKGAARGKGFAQLEEAMSQLEWIEREIRAEGGRQLLEEKLSELSFVNERVELKKRSLVATTLAKVCTSELFDGLDFDAVVIDEGSMASLPYLLVLASHARLHRVIVGDPMQLPPIAMTGDREAREFLEKDIFTLASGADSTGSLFAWHDRNKECTCFFDTQYRLQPSLASLISTVFYEGRLRSAGTENAGTGSVGIQGDYRQEGRHPAAVNNRDRAWHLVDTSRYGPVLTQKSGGQGFQPVNEIHQQLIVRLIENMLSKGISPGDIGVMVPFRSTVYDLRTRLYEKSIRELEVGTVHTFQGREKPYILFDTVMSGEESGGRIRHYSVRPLDETKNGLSVPRLLNVAFSRSRIELIILADMRHIRHVYGKKFLGRLLERMVK